MDRKQWAWGLSLGLALVGISARADDKPASSKTSSTSATTVSQTSTPAQPTAAAEADCEDGSFLWNFLHRHRRPAAICPPEYTAPMPGEEGKPPTTKPTEPERTPSPAFAQAPEAGTGESGSFVPNMFGDQSIPLVCDQIVGILRRGTFIPLPLGASNVVQAGDVFVFQSGRKAPASLLFAPGSPITHFANPACVPLGRPFQSGVKITENESPRPQDRVFVTYNFYDNVFGSLNPGLAQTNFHRELIGFEKTFFDGNASFGMRLPFLQITGDQAIRREDLGDLTMILKYAFVNDRATGDVFSTGLAVTAPTGNSFGSEIHSTLLQPYMGTIYTFGNFYLQGFSSLIVPSDSRDVTYWNNDLALGYFLYRASDPGQRITAVAPTVEVHVSTPLNHRGIDTDPIPGIDVVDLTFGVTTVINRRSALMFGVVTPLTGPKPFDVEAQVYFNFRF